VSAIETTTVASKRSKIVRNLMDKVLPLTGLPVAAIVNAAWIGLLGYFFLKLV
jgi:hypothetical protein